MRYAASKFPAECGIWPILNAARGILTFLKTACGIYRNCVMRNKPKINMFCEILNAFKIEINSKSFALFGDDGRDSHVMNDIVIHSSPSLLCPRVELILWKQNNEHPSQKSFEGVTIATSCVVIVVVQKPCTTWYILINKRVMKVETLL